MTTLNPAILVKNIVQKLYRPSSNFQFEISMEVILNEKVKNQCFLFFLIFERSETYFEQMFITCVSW
jgi:hypothetical protein